VSDKEVNILVDARPVGDVKKPFADLKAGADAADEALIKPRNRLKEIGGELRSTEKGVKNFQGGLVGLAASASLVDERLAKATAALGTLHSATQLFRGAGMLAGVGGVGGLLAPLAAGIAAVGAVALATSPKLQESLGGAMYRMSDAAKEATAQLQRLRQAQEDLATARQFGGGTLAEEAKVQGELGVRRPFAERIRSLTEHRARAEDRSWILGLAPDRGFDPTREALGRIGQSPLDPNATAAGLLGREGALRGLAGTEFRTPPELRREQFVENRAGERAQKEVEALQGKLADFEERQGIAKRLGEFARTRNRFEALWQEAGGGKGLKGAAPELDRLQRQMRQNAPEEARLRAQLGGRAINVTGAEGADLHRQLQEAEDRLAASKEKTLEIQHRINTAQVENLKAIQASAAEQAKLAAQAVREEEAKLRGNKIGLGLMSGEDLLQAQHVSRKIAAGQKLGEADIKFARGLDIFKPALEQQGLHQAEGSSVIQEILKNVGADQRVQQAKEAQAALVKLDAELKHQIDVKLTADAAQVAQQIQERIVPGLSKSIEEATKALAFSLEQHLGQKVKQMILEMRRNEEANKNK